MMSPKKKKKKTQINSEITSDIFHTWLFPAFPIWEQRKTQSSLLIIHMTLSDGDPRFSGKNWLLQPAYAQKYVGHLVHQ